MLCTGLWKHTTNLYWVLPPRYKALAQEVWAAGNAEGRQLSLNALPEPMSLWAAILVAWHVSVASLEAAADSEATARGRATKPK